MLAMRSSPLGSAMRIGAMLAGIAAAVVMAACGDDPTPDTCACHADTRNDDSYPCFPTMARLTLHLQ